MSFIERITALHKDLNHSMSVLSAIERGQLRKEGGEIRCDGVRAWVCYQDSTCTILMSEYETGAVWPEHDHASSDEFLLPTEGEFEITMMDDRGSWSTPMVAGVCVKVPCGIVHTVRCTQRGKLAALCVPPEGGYEQ